MSIKEDSQKKNKKQENFNYLENPFNSFLPKVFPNPYNYNNIINDNESDQESISKEKKKSKHLINTLKEDKNEIKSKINFNKKDEEKDEVKEKTPDIEIHLNSDNLKDIKENKEQMPTLYLYDKIKYDIFPKMNLKEEIKESFIRSEFIINEEKKMSDEAYNSKKTRKRGLNKSNEEIKKKRGRKKNDDPSNSAHNKDSPDNIIKKIKSKLLEYLLKFINDLLNSLKENNKVYFNIDNKNEKEENEPIIKKIDYNKIVNDMKRQNNLSFLKMELKEFLSNKISSKYSTLSKDSNKKTINKLLNKEKDNLIIKYIFNLKFGDWIDIFTYKKEVEDFGSIDNESIKKIEKYFQKVDSLLKEIYNLENGNDYFSLFISLLYNFERWFFVKQNRDRKDKIEKKKIKNN